jgi:hypothetical protein
LLFASESEILGVVQTEIEPKLDAPGAGLPKAELFLARRLFAMKRRMGSRDSFTKKFQDERALIRKMIEKCDAETGSKRVLIERVRGLEDSSRYWSVWMTLEHLRIVHTAMTKVIGSLTNGIAVPGAASTAAVKPGVVGAEVVGGFEKSCDDLLAVVGGMADLETKLTYSHPWFGPLNAAGWHALAAGHLEIHRVQIERILEGLRELAKAP